MDKLHVTKLRALSTIRCFVNNFSFTGCLVFAVCQIGLIGQASMDSLLMLYKKKGGLLASKHILLGARSRTVTRERMVVISGQYIARIIHNSKHWSIATIYRFLARLAAKSVCVKMPGLNWQ